MIRIVFVICSQISARVTGFESMQKTPVVYHSNLAVLVLNFSVCFRRESSPLQIVLVQLQVIEKHVDTLKVKLNCYHCKVGDGVL